MEADITVKEIEQASAEALEKIGFKVTGALANYRISETVYGWVGLNISKHSEFIRINPNIGVHCIPVMRSFDDIRGGKYQARRLATYSVPLGVILPDEDQIVIRDRSEIEGEIGRLASYIRDFGKTYMEQFADLSVLGEALYQNIGQLGGYPERYALTLLLNGKGKEFHEFFVEQLAAYTANGEIDLVAEWEDFGHKAESCIRKYTAN
jgi:hypothetical protein